MSALLEFGDPDEPVVQQTFRYFGVDIRLHPEFSELELMDFMEAAGQMDEDDPKAITAVKGFFRSLVYPEDFEKFWTTAKKHGQGVAKLMELVSSVIEALTERPTPRPRGSSAGRRKTGTRSKRDSYSRALHQLEGHPGLREMVVMAEEARRAG